MLGFGALRNRLAGLRGRASDYFVYRTEDGISKAIQYFAKQKLARQGGPKFAHDWLLAGRPDKFAETAYGVRFNSDGTINHIEGTYPWMTMKTPADLRLPVYWDGKLPNGGDVYTIGYRHYHAEDASSQIRNAANVGLTVGTVTAAFTFAISIGSSLDNFGVGWPEWNVGTWIFDLPLQTLLHAIASGSALYIVDAIGKFIELLASGGGTIVSCALLSAAVFAASFPAAALMTLNKALGQHKDALTSKLAVPTKDSMFLWKNTISDRSIHMKVYASTVIEALTRRAKLPVIKVGIATGLLRYRGLSTAPVRGQDLCWDGESIRSHVFFFGKTGTGKTRRGLRPFFRRVMEANWGDHSVGACVFDGKGELPFEIRKEIPAHRMKDVAIVGTYDGAFGVDLLAGMDPVEVADAFFLVATQVNGGGQDGTKWISGAAGAIKQAAFLARFLEERGSAASTVWGNRKYKPYSLLGLMAISTEDRLNQDISDAILDAAERGMTIESDAVEAARFFNGTWSGYAAETRSSYLSNITDTLGKLSGTNCLAERFASGKSDAIPMIDIAQAFEGRIICIGLSEIEDGQAGLIVANWIKSQLYLIAQRRVVQAAKAREMLDRVQDCVANFDAFQSKSAALGKLDKRLQLAVEEREQECAEKFGEAKVIFADIFPDHRDVSFDDVGLMRKLMKSESEGVETRLQGFTKDVMDLASPANGNEAVARSRLAELKRVEEAPRKSSCMCMIDEYQDFVTVGSGGKADSSFLNKARATGLFVVAATQSVHALNMKIGHDAASNILNNFVSKIFFQTGDPATYEYCIKMAGEGFQSRTFAKNFYANFSQVMAKVREELVAPSIVRARNILWPKLKLAVDDKFDAFHRSIQEIDVGGRNNVNWGISRDGENKSGELRRNFLERQDAIEKEIKEGGMAPYITVDDLARMSGGHAFCIIDRAGMERKDFVYLGI